MTARKPRILIVEDEAPIRTGLTDVLVFHGYEVDSAADGMIGLAKALGGRFDLILLDVMLPGLDGFTICERVRAADREQPIILLTARGTDEDTIHGLSLGADDYVTKPFSVRELIARINVRLRRPPTGGVGALGQYKFGSVTVDFDLSIDCLDYIFIYPTGQPMI